MHRLLLALLLSSEEGFALTSTSCSDPILPFFLSLSVNWNEFSTLNVFSFAWSEWDALILIPLLTFVRRASGPERMINVTEKVKPVFELCDLVWYLVKLFG